jgi:hypothetical protein
MFKKIEIPKGMDVLKLKIIDQEVNILVNEANSKEILTKFEGEVYRKEDVSDMAIELDISHNEEGDHKYMSDLAKYMNDLVVANKSEEKFNQKEKAASHYNKIKNEDKAFLIRIKKNRAKNKVARKSRKKNRK